MAKVILVSWVSRRISAVRWAGADLAIVSFSRSRIRKNAGIARFARILANAATAAVRASI